MILGIDLGNKRIGIAASDPLLITAQRLETLQSQGDEQDIAHIEVLIKEREIKTVVIGLPLNMNGSEGPMAEKARSFAQQLEEKTGVEVVLWDERMTSLAAQRVLLEADVSRAKRRKKIDAMAAQLILQGYLDRRKENSS